VKLLAIAIASPAQRRASASASAIAIAIAIAWPSPRRAAPRRRPRRAAHPIAAALHESLSAARVANLPFFLEAISWPEPQYGVFGHPVLRRLRRAAPLRVDVRKGQTDGRTDGDDK